MDSEVDLQAERAALRVGKLLKGKWRLDRLLGLGGMAAVYAATHRNGKRVAVKMLHPEISFDADVRQRFLREGYVANAVEHPGALTVDDDDVDDDGSAFLVMELLQGETLDARLERCGGRLRAEDVLPLVDQVLGVLAAAHAKGIVHRDLKPENLFLTRDGAVKVLDFGIARLREASGPTSATQTGALMGTPAFMSPEQARGRWEDVDARSDLWAIGATLFTLLTGRHVHEAETVGEALAMAVMVEARSIATVAPELPSPVVDLVDRALQHDRARRFPDAASMQRTLRDAYREITGGVEIVSQRAPAAGETPEAPAASGLTPGPAVAPPPSAVTGPGVSATVNRAAPGAPPGRASRASLSRGGALAALAGLVLLAGTLVFLGSGPSSTTEMAGEAPRAPVGRPAGAPAPAPAPPGHPTATAAGAAPAPPPAEARTAKPPVAPALAAAPKAAPATPPAAAPRTAPTRKAVDRPRSAAPARPSADPFSGRF